MYYIELKPFAKWHRLEDEPFDDYDEAKAEVKRSHANSECRIVWAKDAESLARRVYYAVS